MEREKVRMLVNLLSKIQSNFAGKVEPGWVRVGEYIHDFCPALQTEAFWTKAV
jgi:hypothetical protein